MFHVKQWRGRTGTYGKNKGRDLVLNGEALDSIKGLQKKHPRERAAAAPFPLPQRA